MVHIAADDFSGATSKAWVIKECSSFTEMTLETIQRPAPGAGQLLVKIIRACTNPVDYKRCSWPAPMAAYPAAVGIDGAGVVEAVGDGVTNFKAGDKVQVIVGLGSGFGTFAEHALVSAEFAVVIPDGVSFDQAAALPTCAVTAYAGLFDKFQVEEGKTLLVTGGAGGVGQFVIQMAANKGLKVITTCSTGNVATLKALGAHHVIDYTKEKVAEAVAEITKGAGVNYLYDCVSPANLKEAIGSVAAHGQVLSIVGNVETDVSFFMRGLSAHHVLSLLTPPAVMREQLAITMKWTAEGKISVPVTKTIKLEEVKAQLTEQAAGHVKGKVVIAVAEA